jgi:hypothetical protein
VPIGLTSVCAVDWIPMKERRKPKQSAKMACIRFILKNVVSTRTEKMELAQSPPVHQSSGTCSAGSSSSSSATGLGRVARGEAVRSRILTATGARLSATSVKEYTLHAQRQSDVNKMIQRSNTHSIINAPGQSNQ